MLQAVPEQLVRLQLTFKSVFSKCPLTGFVFVINCVAAYSTAHFSLFQLSMVFHTFSTFLLYFPHPSPTMYHKLNEFTTAKNINKEMLVIVCCMGQNVETENVNKILTSYFVRFMEHYVRRILPNFNQSLSLP